jgi:hypothetical protein
MASTGIQNYVNTVIFTVVLKIISIIVLGAILMGYVNENIMYFLITIEVGIVIIIVAALWSISSYEKRIAEETKNILKAKMTLMGCPDYHTQGAQNICLSNYTTPDGRYTYMFGNNSNNVNLASYVNKGVDEACTNYNKSIMYTDATNNIVYKYPWTEMAAKCDIL